MRLFTKVFKMSTICMDTCLETLSGLVNCTVDNVYTNLSVQMVLRFPRCSNILKVWWEK